jgi:hypothetical protein
VATRSSPPICDSAGAATESFNAHELGVARTGRSECVDDVRVARIRRGRQVSVSLMFDRLLMLEQFGLA